MEGLAPLKLPDAEGLRKEARAGDLRLLVTTVELSLSAPHFRWR